MPHMKHKIRLTILTAFLLVPVLAKAGDGYSRNEVSLSYGQVPNIPNAFNAALDGGSWMNRLVYGDNLLTMQALLAGDPQTGLPSRLECLFR